MAGALTYSHIFGAMASTWAVIGIAVWWDQTAPLGWWTLKPKTKAEEEMSKYYDRRISPYPEDSDAIAEYLQKGGKTNSVIPPRPGQQREFGEDVKLKLHEAKVEKEAFKLWLRMRREATRELQEQGYPVE